MVRLGEVFVVQKFAAVKRGDQHLGMRNEDTPNVRAARI